MKAKGTRSSTMISVEGDRLFIAAMAALATKRKTTQAKLVRTALDQVYGKDLEPLIRFFYANNGT